MIGAISNTQNSPVELLDLVVDLKRRSVTRAGVAIELPELSFRLLAALIDCSPDTLDKDELIQRVWGSVVVSDETLSQRVRLLRQALGEDGQEPRYIAAVRGRGYRMICPVKALPASAGGGARRWRWRWVVLAVATILAALLLLFSGQRQGQPVVQSVAVLPFADLSPDQNHRYFADGMQEEILSRLARLENLSVASRTSVEQYRNTRKSLPIIARELGVDAIIESSVRVADERVRITVQLIDAKTDRHLWSGTFDRELSVENIFAIQQEVALQVGRELQSGVIRGSRWSLLPTRHLAAYDAYLLGRYHTYRQTPEDLTLGIAHLQEAVNLDPDFARAWAALGWAYSFEGTIYGRDAPKNVFPRAREAVTRALSIDNQLADARDLYADILAWYDWDFAAAEREYRKAMELDPMQVLGYVVFLSTQLRHEEAVGLIRRRVAATPGDPWVRVNAAWAYLHARQFDQAIAEANLAQPHTDSAAVLGFAYLGQGLTDKALAVFERDIERQGRGPRQLSHLAIANFRAGRVAQGRSLLAELEAEAGRRYLSPDLLADAYFAAGDANNGFARLFEAVDQRARGVIFVQTSLLLDGYRADPRYQSLLHAVGFQ